MINILISNVAVLLGETTIDHFDIMVAHAEHSAGRFYNYPRTPAEGVSTGIVRGTEYVIISDGKTDVVFSRHTNRQYGAVLSAMSDDSFYKWYMSSYKPAIERKITSILNSAYHYFTIVNAVKNKF